MRQYCATCADERSAATAADLCDDPLFPQGEVWENCQALDGMESGYARFCINRRVIAAESVGVNFNACQDLNTGQSLTVGCGVNPSSSLEELGNSYGAFVAPDTAGLCELSFQRCVEPTRPQPSQPTTTYDDDEDESNWVQGCAGAVCEGALAGVCASICEEDESDSSDTSTSSSSSTEEDDDDSSLCSGDE